MDKIKKVIYWSSISLIVFWFLMPVIRWITKLELANNSLKSNCEGFFFVAIPIAVLLTLVKTIKKTDVLSEKVAKTLITIVIAFCSIVFAFFSLFTNMCTWTDRDILFQNKSDLREVIIERDFGCGAWGSDPAKSKLFKMIKYGDYFIKTTKIDTSKIDKDEWTKISLPTNKITKSSLILFKLFERNNNDNHSFNEFNLVLTDENKYRFQYDNIGYKSSEVGNFKVNKDTLILKSLQANTNRYFLFVDSAANAQFYTSANTKEYPSTYLSSYRLNLDWTDNNPKP
jgi:hypothetical protein